MKKQFIVSLLAVVTVIGGTASGMEPEGPIKIGFLTQMTGGGAAVGKDMSNGFTMYIEEIVSR